MNTDQLMNEIRETNLAYLLLAQTMVRQDKAQALYRLGISEGVADIIATMSPQQLMRVASQNLMLCQMRFDDEVVWGLMSEHKERNGVDQSASRLHAKVLMAGRHAAAA
jgi:flagellar transcriptional activator FlhD